MVGVSSAIGDEDGSRATWLQSVVVVVVVVGCQAVVWHDHAGVVLAVIDHHMTTASLRVTTFTTPARLVATTLLQSATQRAVRLWREATVEVDERKEEAET